jgi:hypothetical protein
LPEVNGIGVCQDFDLAALDAVVRRRDRLPTPQGLVDARLRSNNTLIRDSTSLGW